MRRQILIAAIAFVSWGKAPESFLRAQEPPAPAPGLSFAIQPAVHFGGGELSYQEHDFRSAPDLESKFEEPVFETGVGVDFIFQGHHALSLDFNFFGTTQGEETWKEAGTLVQENEMDIHRFGFEIGYLGSTWNRALDPRDLRGPERFIRFAGGLNGYYRRQGFDREGFVDFTVDPPLLIDAEATETFDMLGGEVTLGLEFGPRHILCGFLRGKAGGGYVRVMNDGFEPFVDEEDTQIDTASVQGTIEAGILSQFTRLVELRLGYRYFIQEVFEEEVSIDPVVVDPGTTIVGFELPDNTTQMHLIFIEAVFTF